MVVDILYEGFAVQRGATVRAEGANTFVETESPMPVGTRLVLVGPEAGSERSVVVERVQEGAGPGMLLRPLDARMPVAPIASAPSPGTMSAGTATAEPVRHVEQIAASAVQAEPEGDAPSADGGSVEGGGSDGKRSSRKERKKRKTLLGPG